ncbi:MAG TPA: hypothetical protein VMS56_06865 [Thermoanaerobaculia bacterium]|nr:hypothetical protein [Thermoanaerobaculia bacterium]
MKKTTIALIAIAAVALGAGLALRAMREEREWTSSSRAALEAFRQGLSAEKKLYVNEAREHFARAVELDPEFTMARVKSLGLGPKSADRPRRLKELILEADLERLSERERFLLQHRLALIDRDLARADQLTSDYLERHPDDRFALTIHCDRAWGRNDLDAAERCYTKLLEMDPTAVLPRNNLGYIRMAKGEFRAAEEAFAAYGRIAPDQANPHDSLGELLMLTGRYGEASREFERAVAIRSDFCASWAHLIDLALLEGDLARAEATLGRAREAVCPPEFVRSQECRLAIWNGAATASPADTVRLARDAECENDVVDALSIALLHHAAVASGDTALSGKIEADLEKWAEGYRGGMMAALLGHVHGIRLAHENSPDEAIARLREADSRITYNGEGIGVVKMYNRLALARLLESTGAAAEAARIRDEVRRVNPRFADRFATIPSWN